MQERAGSIPAASTKLSNMFEAYDMGYDDGEKEGFNKALEAIKQLISRFYPGSVMEELVKEIDELKKK